MPDTHTASISSPPFVGGGLDIWSMLFGGRVMQTRRGHRLMVSIQPFRPNGLLNLVGLDKTIKAGGREISYVFSGWMKSETKVAIDKNLPVHQPIISGKKMIYEAVETSVSDVSFSIEAGNRKNLFRIDPASGQIWITDSSKLTSHAGKTFNLIIQSKRKDGEDETMTLIIEIHQGRPFISTWAPITRYDDKLRIEMPLLPRSHRYDFDVDWDNDGVYEQIDVTNKVFYRGEETPPRADHSGQNLSLTRFSHTVKNPEPYRIRIQGKFPRLKFSKERI
jgi:hypothetical protein